MKPKSYLKKLEIFSNDELNRLIEDRNVLINKEKINYLE